MHLLVNVLSLAPSNVSGRRFAVEMVAALQSENPEWPIVLLAGKKQTTWFATSGLPALTPPNWAKGMFLKIWLKKTIAAQAPSAAIINMGASLLAAAAAQQLCILAQAPGPKEIARLTKFNIKPLAVWPGVKAACTLSMPKIETALCGCGAGHDFMELDWHEKLSVKTKFTEGREYFYYHQHGATTATVLNVLKAFSIFKKRQQCGMKLVLPQANEAVIKALATYKYREDILTELPSKAQARLVGGAYAVIFTEGNNNDLSPLVQALQCAKPMICWPRQNCEPVAGGAALYPETLDPQTLSAPMMLLYTNEQKLLSLQLEALEQLKFYNWQNCAKIIRQALPNAE